MAQELRLENFTISVTRKKIRHLYLRMGVLPDHLRVSVPMKTTEKEILSFVSSKKNWIEKQGKARQCGPKNFSDTIPFGEGSLVSIWGTSHRLRFVENHDGEKISVSGTSVLFHRLPDTSQDRQKQELDRWLGSLLEAEVRLLVQKWERLLAVSPKRVSIRKMKTRWGSCTPALESIRINFVLVYLDKIFLDYVVLHELVHLLEPSHNKRFVLFMDQWMPDWRLLRKDLKELGVF